jgi:hypothetical protein
MMMTNVQTDAGSVSSVVTTKPMKAIAVVAKARTRSHVSTTAKLFSRSLTRGNLERGTGDQRVRVRSDRVPVRLIDLLPKIRVPVLVEGEETC